MNTDRFHLSNSTESESSSDAGSAPQSAEVSSKNERSVFRKAKQHMGIIFVVCAVVFLVLYTLVNLSQLTTIFSAVLSVLTPVLLGGALAYLLNPVFKLFECRVFKKIKKKRGVRGLSLLCTYLVALLLLTGFVFLLIPQLWNSVLDLSRQFPTYVTNTAAWINGIVSKFSENVNGSPFIDEDMLLSTIQNFLFGSGDILEKIAEYIVQYGMGLVVGIKNAVLAVFISIYVLLSKDRLKAQAKKMTTALFSDKSSRHIYQCCSLCHKTFSGFFIGKIIDSLIIGVITLICLLLFRIDYAILVSTIVCVTNVIPVFGPFIGAIPSFFIIFISDPVDSFIFLILIILIQQLDGNVIGPKILGDSTGLSSLGVIISIVIMGEYFGVIGMILGVPIFAVIVALFKNFLESRLRAKGLPTETADYCEMPDAETESKHESILVGIVKRLIPSSHKRARRSGTKRKHKESKKEKEG